MEETSSKEDEHARYRKRQKIGLFPNNMTQGKNMKTSTGIKDEHPVSGSRFETKNQRARLTTSIGQVLKGIIIGLIAIIMIVCAYKAPLAMGATVGLVFSTLIVITGLARVIDNWIEGGK